MFLEQPCTRHWGRTLQEMVDIQACAGITSGKLCFGVDRYWAKWLVSLEADYQRLSKELAELTK